MIKINKTREVVVIAGGAGYLGSFISKKLSEAGFFIVVISKNVKDDDFCANDCMYNVTADIADTNAVEKIAAEVEKKFGKIAVVIHSVSAPLIRKPILSESLEDFESQFTANVTGAFNLFKFFVPFLSPDGAIIGITSKLLLGETTHSPSGSYIPAKSALSGLLRVMSNELKEKSIRVYEVAPAFMPGGLNNDIPKSVAEFIMKKSLPEEIASPEKVAEVVLDLIRDKAKKMAGKPVVITNRKVVDL